MARLLFVSHERMERLAAEGKVIVDGDTMSLPALGYSFRLQPAMYITKVLSQATDPYRLIGRVKTQAQVDALGGRAYDDSLVIREVAYACESGFLGEAIDPNGASGPNAAVAPKP